MLKSVNRIFLIIFGIDVLAFIIGLFTPMDDIKPHPFGEAVFWLVENVLSLPLSLINRDYPFLLDSTFSMIVLVIVNDTILALAIWCIIRILKKLRK